MRKINATLIDKNNKENAILKIKDESFTITTSDNSLIKIPYTNIKNYDYNDEEETLTIIKYGGAIVQIGIEKDLQLLNQLKGIVKENQNNKNKANIDDNKKRDIGSEDLVVNNTQQKIIKNYNSSNNSIENNNANEGSFLKRVFAFILAVIITYFILIGSMSLASVEFPNFYYKIGTFIGLHFFYIPLFIEKPIYELLWKLFDPKGYAAAPKGKSWDEVLDNMEEDIITRQQRSNLQDAVLKGNTKTYEYLREKYDEENTLRRIEKNTRK